MTNGLAAGLVVAVLMLGGLVLYGAWVNAQALRKHRRQSKVEREFARIVKHLRR